MTAINRRTIFGLLGSTAAAGAMPAVAAAQQPQLNEAQRRLALWAYEFKGELALAVAQHVIDAGFGYDDVEGICLTGIRKGETRRVTIDISRSNIETRPVRAFVNVSVGEQRGYIPTVTAMSSAELRKQVLATAFAELEAWRARHAELTELARIFAAMEETRGLLKP